MPLATKYNIKSYLSQRQQPSLFNFNLIVFVFFGVFFYVDTVNQGWATFFPPEGHADLDKVSEGPHIGQLN